MEKLKIQSVCFFVYLCILNNYIITAYFSDLLHLSILKKKLVT